MKSTLSNRKLAQSIIKQALLSNNVKTTKAVVNSGVGHNIGSLAKRSLTRGATGSNKTSSAL